MIQSDCSTHTHLHGHDLSTMHRICVSYVGFGFAFAGSKTSIPYARCDHAVCQRIMFFFLVVITSPIASFIICFCLHKLKMTRPRNIFLPFVFKQLIDLKIYSPS